MVRETKTKRERNDENFVNKQGRLYITIIHFLPDIIITTSQVTLVFALNTS